MALSLRKPVIFYCDQKQKSRFYKEVHPLSRLNDFSTGVAVGAIVTDSTSEVAELLHRIFENKMEYEMEQPKPGHLRLKESLTKSVVRLYTSDQLLAETFWNHYHNRLDVSKIEGSGDEWDMTVSPLQALQASSAHGSTPDAFPESERESLGY